MTPFNFTSIAGFRYRRRPRCLAAWFLWKPAATSMLSAYYIMELCWKRAAAGRDQLGRRSCGGNWRSGAVSSQLGGHLHFTGSTGVFQQMWGTVGNNIQRYHLSTARR